MVHMPRNNSGQYQHSNAEYFQERGKQHTLLPFCQILCAERTLHDRLVRTPVKNIDNQDSGKERMPRYRSVLAYSYGL